ncbi:MAG: molybdate ABC transporter substrate-binding protein [Desulfovibrio sp.]
MDSQKKVLCIALIAFCFCVFFTLFGCSYSNEAEVKKELLIYCGITMIKPMNELAEIIEKEQGCKIIITKGGSGNLLRSIRANGVGDLYLPGSESYIQTCIDEKLISSTVHVGYNKAAMMVQKDNPLNIPNNLTALTNPQYYVVIGNPTSGSIGRETKKILERAEIFKDVLKNARVLTTDSKDLVSVLKNGEADLVVNWYATSRWNENSHDIEVLPIDSKYAKRKNLVLGLLNSSTYPEIAKRFMELASSDKGKAIFNKYGLYEVR